MYKRILAPVDLAQPETATTALRAAGALASPDTETILLYVAPEVPSVVAAQLPEGAMERTVDESKAELERMAASCDGLGRHSVMVEVGQPHHAILDAADKRSADLIVLGAHKPAITDFLLGSTASHVVRHARCAVHIAR